jgi:phage/plasmid-like protein (TIGR03299 family)|tara:strand:- start:1402 stop:2436 length:1035 start_codon:yes stop_codon:yes gene_type:complete
MSHQVETMAWTGDKPWHGLGVEVDGNLTPLQMQQAAQLDWTVSKRPSYTLDAPEWSEEVGLIQAENTFHIVRDSDNRILSHCGRDYVPIQNEDVFKFFKRFTEAGHMTMETAGSLKDGGEVWGLAKIAEDFELAGDDLIKGYLLINQPHIVGRSMTIKLTPIRVVCNNTLTMALGLNGTASFRMPHVKEFGDDVIQAAEEALGLSASAMTEFRKQATLLSQTKAKHSDVLEYVSEIYQPLMIAEYRKEQLLRSTASGTHLGIQEPLKEKLNKFPSLVMDALDHSPGAQLKSAKGTWWGALNAVTYVEDHLRESQTAGNALHSAWFGAAANRKSQALSLAIQRAA